MAFTPPSSQSYKICRNFMNTKTYFSSTILAFFNLFSQFLYFCENVCMYLLWSIKLKTFINEKKWEKGKNVNVKNEKMKMKIYNC